MVRGHAMRGISWRSGSTFLTLSCTAAAELQKQGGDKDEALFIGAPAS